MPKKIDSEFIDVHKSEPCLWKVKCDEYTTTETR